MVGQISSHTQKDRTCFSLPGLHLALVRGKGGGVPGIRYLACCLINGECLVAGIPGTQVLRAYLSSVMKTCGAGRGDQRRRVMGGEGGRG